MNTSKAFLVLVTLLTVSVCNADQASRDANADDGSVVERKTYAFPTYEQAVETTDVEKYASKEVYEQAVADPKFEFQKLKYMSDGLKVVAYLYKPKTVEGKKLPVVVFNRGSAMRGDIAPELIHVFHRLASEGFIILAPMYRQSDGGEGHDEMGGADVNDLMNVIPLAKSLGFIEMNNMFMYGESRGGMMTYLAIKRKFPLNAAAVFGALTNLEPLLGDYPATMLNQFWPDFETRKGEIIKARSAIYWPEQLDVPLLIMHGGQDKLAPSQSLDLAQQLQRSGRTYELIIYAQDNHYLRNNQDDRDRRAAIWFKKHVKN